MLVDNGAWSPFYRRKDTDIFQMSQILSNVFARQGVEIDIKNENRCLKMQISGFLFGSVAENMYLCAQNNKD